MRFPFIGLRAPSLHYRFQTYILAASRSFRKEVSLGSGVLLLICPPPSGRSVNDGINPEEFSLQYIKVDQIILMASKYGSGALMAKFDVEAAYRNIAVHPDDRFLLGMKWRGKYFVDLALPFGLRLSSIRLQTWLSGSSCIGIISQIYSTTMMTLLPQGYPIPLSVLSIYKLPYPFARN